MFEFLRASLPISANICVHHSASIPLPKRVSRTCETKGKKRRQNTNEGTRVGFFSTIDEEKVKKRRKWKLILVEWRRDVCMKCVSLLSKGWKLFLNKFYILRVFIPCQQKYFYFFFIVNTFFLSRIEPRPRTDILHIVSSCSRFKLLPFGPRSFPTKLNYMKIKKRLFVISTY